MPDERFVAESGISSESRFLDGHFDGNPIVPGAMILGHLAAWLAPSGKAIGRIDRMKFMRPLRPGVRFEVILKSASQAEFWDSDGIFARARLVVRPADD